MVFSKIIDGAGRVVLFVFLVLIFANSVYGLGKNKAARDACIRSGFPSGFATKNDIICVYHVNYVPKLSK